MTSLRVLHVDDEPDIREVVELALGLDPSLAVQSCGSGPAALIAAATWSPDLILLDVMMPGMDGPTTLAHLRKSPKTAGIPVVFMTARVQQRELDRFVSLGAEGVIAKPFDPMTLAASVHSHVSTLKEPQRRDYFLKWMHVNAVTLARCRATLRDESDPTASLERIRTIAHDLASPGGVFEPLALGAPASVLEGAVLERLKTADGDMQDVELALDLLLAKIETSH
jgi:CheY-like chemotaxis protein